MGVFLTIVLSRDKFKNTHMAPLHQVHKLEQLEFKLEKVIGISKHAGKVRKLYISNLDKFLQE